MKFPHSAIVKAPSLLPMDYKVSEIANHLDIPPSTLRDWLRSGAPHFRDQSRRIWVAGEKFAEWVETNRKKKRVAKLKENEAYCFRCKTVVTMQSTEVVPIKGKLINVRGFCPVCNCRINRGGRAT